MIEFFDKYGQEIDRRTWALLHEDEDYCRIGYTEVGHVYVSTVWLGESHGRMFETMVFWISSGVNGDLPSTRWPTLEEAKAGHKAMVAQAVAEERR